jgi:hypothetical protein
MYCALRTIFPVLCCLLLSAAPAIAQDATNFSPQELHSRMVERRAVEAAIWGMPIVSFDAMREAGVRDAGAKYNDIIYWSQPADWKFQFTTPNASTRYVYFNFNLKDGPVVIDVPPTVGAGLFGSLLDVWQVPVADIGPAGKDGGKGGKYLLLPPGYKNAVPAGYIPIQWTSLNGYSMLRAIPATNSAADVAKAIALIKQLRVYPLAQAANPRPQRYIDMAGKLLDGVVTFDSSFYVRLSQMVNEEAVQTRDLVAMGQLTALGIEKGKEFTPDAATNALLKEGAEEAHETFMQEVGGGTPWWQGSQWKLPETTGPKTGFTYQTDDAFFVDDRGLVYFLAFAPPKKLGAASFYLVSAHDSAGQALDGGKNYKLHVPADVPARQYWAATVYDLGTACLIRGLSRPGLDSFNQAMHKNADGSVDLYFGPTPPKGEEANWIPTVAGKPWFTIFRLYGPEKPLFDKSWKLDDIEAVK